MGDFLEGCLTSLVMTVIFGLLIWGGVALAEHSGNSGNLGSMTGYALIAFGISGLLGVLGAAVFMISRE